MTLDPAVADLLKAVDEVLRSMANWHRGADWRTVAVRSALGRVLAGQDDPGAAADWLRGFLAQREGATR